MSNNISFVGVASLVGNMKENVNDCLKEHEQVPLLPISASNFRQLGGHRYRYICRYVGSRLNRVKCSFLGLMPHILCRKGFLSLIKKLSRIITHILSKVSKP